MHIHAYEINAPLTYSPKRHNTTAVAVVITSSWFWINSHIHKTYADEHDDSFYISQQSDWQQEEKEKNIWFYISTRWTNENVFVFHFEWPCLVGVMVLCLNRVAGYRRNEKDELEWPVYYVFHLMHTPPAQKIAQNMSFDRYVPWQFYDYGIFVLMKARKVWEKLLWGLASKLLLLMIILVRLFKQIQNAKKKYIVDYQIRNLNLNMPK